MREHMKVSTMANESLDGIIAAMKEAGYVHKRLGNTEPQRGRAEPWFPHLQSRR